VHICEISFFNFELPKNSFHDLGERFIRVA
jgi:hypothetical protein